MDQRRELRFQVNQNVRVTVLEPARAGIDGKIRNASGRGIGVELPERLAPGTAVKLDLDDSFLLGEVIYCRADGESWYAGIELEHALFGLAALAATLSDFSEERSGPEHAYALQDARRQNPKQSRQ